jgi:hypothetical protein
VLKSLLVEFDRVVQALNPFFVVVRRRRFDLYPSKAHSGCLECADLFCGDKYIKITRPQLQRWETLPTGHNIMAGHCKVLVPFYLRPQTKIEAQCAFTCRTTNAVSDGRILCERVLEIRRDTTELRSNRSDIWARQGLCDFNYDVVQEFLTSVAKAVSIFEYNSQIQGG